MERLAQINAKKRLKRSHATTRSGSSTECAQSKQIYDANPDVQNLVKNFDDKGITLSTKQEADSDTPTKTTDPADATVDQMAKRATNAAL